MSLFAKLANSFTPPNFILEQSCGIDLSDHSVKYLDYRLPVKDDVPTIDKMIRLPIKDGVIRDGDIIDNDLLEQELKIYKNVFKKRFAHISLPEELVFVFYFFSENSKASDIKGEIELKINEFVPADPAKLNYDFSFEDFNGGSLVSVSAFPKDIVDEYKVAIEGLGIVVKSAEIETLSMARAIRVNNKNEFYAILDMGGSKFTLSIFYKDLILFSATQKTDITALLNKIYNDDKERRFDFDDWKLKEGLIFVDKSVADPVFEEIFTQVNKYLSYWEQNFDNGNLKVEQIYLVGGNSNLAGLDVYLTNKLMRRVSFPDFSYLVSGDEIIKYNKHNYSSFATCIGLVLKDFELCKIYY